MNIFIVDTDPKIAARDLCDKHVVKMILESAQLLCSQFESGAPYKRTHYNHPCSIWTRTSKDNFLWLVEHAIEMGEEYTRRYGKVHKSISAVEWARDNINEIIFINSANDLTNFAICVPDIYKIHNNPVLSYQNFYIKDKSKFAKWKLNNKPNWFYHGEFGCNVSEASV